MKSLFIFRDCYEAMFILKNLEKRGLVQTVILETGKDAKMRKLKKMFKKNILQYPIIILDIISLLIYSSVIEYLVIRRLGKTSYPKDKIKLIVDDANSEKCIEFIQIYKPQVIFIYGTALLSKEFIKKSQAIILNIHAGILPFYRNVHGDFWVYKRKDYKNAGVSLFFLNTGIDTGDIALQKRISYKEKDSLVDIKLKNLILIPELVYLAKKKLDKGILKRTKQNNSLAGFYPTPRFKDIMLYFVDILKLKF